MKTTLLIPTLVAFASLTFSLAAVATNGGIPKFPPAQDQHYSPFRQQIQDVQKTCPKLGCTDSELEVVLLDTRTQHSLPIALQDDFKNVALQIINEEWPDTILEGPYAAAFNPIVDKVAYIFHNETAIGYFITFHDQAWYTDTCNYDPQHPDSLQACNSGKLIESVFVRLDLEESFRNPVDFVAFVADK